jgi:hypothetical protein
MPLRYPSSFELTTTVHERGPWYPTFAKNERDMGTRSLVWGTGPEERVVWGRGLKAGLVVEKSYGTRANVEMAGCDL